MINKMKCKEVLLEKHIQLVSEVADKIWREHFTSIIGEQQVSYMLNKFLSVSAIQSNKKQGFRYFLMYNDSDIIGFFAVCPQEDSLFLSKLYIYKQYRNKGYSRKAIQYIENMARMYHYNEIRLTCNKYNNSALQVYKHYGFIIFKDEVSDIGNGYVMDDHCLKKIL